MSVPNLEYPLRQGHVHNWLVAGPYAAPVEDLERFQGEDYRQQIARHYHTNASDIHELPVERGTFQIHDQVLIWHYGACLDDHLLDLSAYYPTCHYVRAWAYAQVRCPSPQEVTFVLTTTGPANLWLNGRNVYRREQFSEDPQPASFKAGLEEGWNEVLVRFEEVAARECTHAMALQIPELASQEAVVGVPTDTLFPERRLLYERAFEHTYIDRDVAFLDQTVTLHWTDDLDTGCPYAFRLQDPADRIYAEGSQNATPSSAVNIGALAYLSAGEYRVVVMPPPEEYYVGNVRYRRNYPLRVFDVQYSRAPYGTFEERRRSALEQAAKQENGLYAEVARFALGRWASADTKVLMASVEKIGARHADSDIELIGLLGLLTRYPKPFGFLQQFRRSLQGCILGFRYWHDEPGSDVMSFDTESHAILFHTCQILAGQLFPDLTFSNTAQPGQWHRQKGERLALDWLRARGTTGFAQWDSHSAFEQDLLALSHLADLAQNQEVAELAAVTMDKLLFSLALNSFQGTFGSSHALTSAPALKSGQLEPTSPISRLLWGMGVWNQHIRGVVALACSAYELPPIIADIAADPAEEMWSREQHPGVNKVTYRTPDYMLCSAQDYRPGQPGDQQHIWHATLGPDAVAFVNHPACMSEDDAHRPNFWRGNAVLPRVAQWKDALVAVHKLPDDDWMGFTHAYFPAYEFDEYVLVDRWAFARKGNGYLALAAQQGLELVKRGPNGYRELRSSGQHNVWLCFMGRQALDDSFAQFQERVLALDIDWQELGVRCTTLRNQTLAFGWEGPLLVDGQEQPLSGFRHYDNPYCVTEPSAPQMDIQYGEYLLRLHFEPGEGGNE